MEQVTLTFQAPKQGLLEISKPIKDWLKGKISGSGMLHLFVRHTSASLIIQENADPAVQRDLEAFLDRLVPEDDPFYTHTQEGPDDMPAHVKGVLTATSLSVPIQAGRLALGTWQGIYLWEHRQATRPREIVLTLSGA